VHAQGGQIPNIDRITLVAPSRPISRSASDEILGLILNSLKTARDACGSPSHPINSYAIEKKTKKKTPTQDYRMETPGFHAMRSDARMIPYDRRRRSGCPNRPWCGAAGTRLSVIRARRRTLNAFLARRAVLPRPKKKKIPPYLAATGCAPEIGVTWCAPGGSRAGTARTAPHQQGYPRRTTPAGKCN